MFYVVICTLIIAFLFDYDAIGEYVFTNRKDALNRLKDAEKNNIIPVIVEGTKVTYTDINNKKHMNESLGSGMLEKLPYFEEYALMQTQDLFRYVHDMVCNEETLKKNLKSIFKS